jgi:hypothetical protein
MASATSRDPRHHTQKMQKRLSETVQHLRETSKRSTSRNSRRCLKRPQKS